MQVFKPAAPFAGLCLLLSPWMPAPVEVFLGIATWLTCMSQQFHAWSHMKKSDLHPVVDALQVSLQNPIGETMQPRSVIHSPSLLEIESPSVFSLCSIGASKMHASWIRTCAGFRQLSL